MPLLALPWWGWALLTGGAFTLGGITFSNISKKMLFIGLVGVGVYAYAKAKN